MAEKVRLCSTCFDQLYEMHQVNLHEGYEDLYHCPGCNSDIQSYMTYTKDEVLRHLKQLLDELPKLIKLVEALENE